MVCLGEVSSLVWVSVCSLQKDLYCVISRLHVGSLNPAAHDVRNDHGLRANFYVPWSSCLAAAGGGSGISWGCSVKDPLLSSGRGPGLKCIVLGNPLKSKVQETENEPYSASWRADMCLRTQTVFMGLNITLRVEGALAATSCGFPGVKGLL